MPEPLLMLVILEACLQAQTLPAKGSPCHKQLKKIISRWKKERSARRLRANLVN